MYKRLDEIPEYCCRWAPTLGALEDSHEKVWGTKTYDPVTDRDKPTVFFGLYGLPDWYELWNHVRAGGKAYILWAGSDITHFVNGYWLDRTGTIKLDPKAFGQWINKYCESYVENSVEHAALLDLGIDAYVVPSFLGPITGYPQSYQHSDKPKLYTSVSGDNFELYGWNELPTLALAHPDIEFHLYGSDHEWPKYLQKNWPNLINHGRVPKEVMNAEIATMQGAIRLTKMDGFSEILAKSILMEQYPVSHIPYPHILKVDQIGMLHSLKEPNVSGREHYQKILNQYPWNQK